MLEYAALVASPRALPDGLILVFQHPAKRCSVVFEEARATETSASNFLPYHNSQ